MIDRDYWYEHRADLASDQEFWCCDGSKVKLDRRVPGDGTQRYVADWSNNSWSYYDRRIEPSDLSHIIVGSYRF